MNQKCRKHFLLLLILLLNSCSATHRAGRDDVGQMLQVPVDYNSPNMHVFAITTTRISNELLYRDTLGLMTTDFPCSWDSTQNMISWLYLSSKEGGGYILNNDRVNNSYTGMQSTANDLFLHPPRHYQYTILQICPYPYLHFPLFIEKKWNWKLDVSSRWCPSDSIKWNENETFRSHYTVVDTNTIQTSFGVTPCYHIQATNTSKLGTSSADFYYSYQYGLVKLLYLPLDNTKVEFNLLTSVYDQALFNAMFPRHVKAKNQEGWFGK